MIPPAAAPAAVSNAASDAASNASGAAAPKTGRSGGAPEAPAPAPWSPTSPATPGGNPLVPIIALFVVGLAFRPSIVVIGPLLPTIRQDLDISYAVAGLLTTIPILCLGLFAPVGPWLAMRLGPRNAVAACVAIVATFSLLRTLVPDAWMVIALTFGLGIGMGMAGPVLSIIVRLRAPRRPGLATGAYAGGFVVGGSLSALLAIPLAGPDVDWRRSLASVALVGFVSLAAWLLLLGRDRPHERVDKRPRSLPWREPMVWALVVVFGLQSILYYGTATWLPNVYVERGWDQAAAGALVGLINITAVLGTFGAPLIADRWGSRRIQLLAIALMAGLGMLGVIALPDLGFLWATVLGLALGCVFPLVLILPVDVADRPGEIGATAALMLLGGYVLASVGPATLGLVRDLTGNFTTVLWALVVLSVIFGFASWLLSPARLRVGLRSAPEAAKA